MPPVEESIPEEGRTVESMEKAVEGLQKEILAAEEPPRDPMTINEKCLVWFEYHAPKPEQVEQYNTLRAAALQFANVVLACTPNGPDQTTAIRKIREAVMTANAAIACGGI